jgi:hypothetical protein
MSKWPMRGHFRYLRFKTFSMTPRTPQYEVFWALLSKSKHSGVPEDSKSPILGVLGFTPTLGQNGVATSTFQNIFNDIKNAINHWVLMPEIALWNSGSPPELHFPKWELPWECEGSLPHIFLLSREYVMWLPGSLLACTLATPLPWLWAQS